MNAKRVPELDARSQVAVAGLQAMLRERYPKASFRLRRGIDDPESIQLVATVDVEDTDEVLDVVIDRVMELQIEERLPVHVIPVRPRERVLAMLAKQEETSRHRSPTIPPNL
jgi:hypothetical protein